LTSLPRIGYVPYSASLQAPGDRRRFVAYAQARNLPYEPARFDERYDVVVLSEVADISVWPEYRQGKIVYDLIDSYLSVPRTDWRQLLRGPAWYALGKHKRLQDYLSSLRAMCRRADAVVCTTDEQKKVIGRFCSNIHVILDIHSAVATKIKTRYVAGRPFRLVWEGLASNLPQLLTLAPILHTLATRKEFELHVVTDAKRPWSQAGLFQSDSRRFLARHFDRVCFHEWSEEACADIITSCDLAVVPIDIDDPFAAGKPENKLLLLWRMGLPAIASATPAYRRAMQDVQTPEYACESAPQWIAALERMMKNENVREEAATRGRRYAETKYGTESLFARWDAVFASLGISFDPSPALRKP
jgi:glycosyltransferase involved in cell wall biosynthesis